MRFLRFILRAVLLLTLAIVIAGGLLVFQMSNGTLSAGFLKDRLVSVARSNMPPGSDISLSDLRFGFGPDWSLVVEGSGMSADIGDRGRIEADSARTELAFMPLLMGSVEPVSLTAEGLSATVSSRPVQQPTGSRAEFLRQAFAGFGRAAAGLSRRLDAAGLRSVDIADLEISGPALDRMPFAADLPLRVSLLRWRPAEGGTGTISAEVRSAHGDWSALIVPGADADSRPVVDVTIRDFPPAFVYPPITDTARRPYYDAVAEVQARIQLDETGGLDVARLHGSLGSGYLSMVDDDAAIIDRVDFALELSASSDALRLARSDIRFGGTHVVFRGEIGFGSFGEPMTYALELGETELSPFGDGQEPVVLEAGNAAGYIDLGGGAIRLQKAAISGPEGALRAVGSFRFKGAAPGLSGVVEVEETTARMVRALWPPILARKTRAWFDRNVKSALLGPGTVQIALPKENLGRAGKGRPLPPDGLIGEVPFRYGLFTPLRDLPLVRSAFGSLEFADATAIVKLNQAEVTAVGFGTAGVGETEFRIPDLGKPDPVGYLDLGISGPAAALAQLSNAGRLNIAEDRGISPEALSGEAELSLKAAFSLTKRARPEDVDADFDLRLTEFASKEPITGQLISAADLAIKGTPAAYSVAGSAKIDGMPAKIDLTSGGADSQSTVKLTMDEAARKKLGIDLGSLLSGPVVASVTPQADSRVQDISIDLEPATINLPFVGWQKGAGVPATFKARIKRTGKGAEVSNIIISGDGFQAAGELEVGQDGKLSSLNMREIALRQDDDFAVSLDTTGNGYRVSVSGASFDARGLITQLQSADADLSGVEGRYSISVKLAQLRGYNSVALSGVAGSLVIDDGRLQAISMQAGTGTAQPIELVIGEEAEQRRVNLRSGNGGALLRFLNIYDKAFGGDLVLEFGGPADAPDGQGHVTLSNFRVQNEHAFDQAAAERRSSNPDREVRSTDIVIDTTNISFAKLRVPFVKRAEALVFSDASLRGPVVGATGKGTLDLKARNLSISGTIVPAYGINNLPGSIPILGQLLGGRKREGLIGITYQIFGPINAPTLKLNPASAIAPGIFRRIFEY
ncbi:MAG TPA: AsmA-like C-terminal region-containing protein [Afifellaceae bacterium]|nr:AsmA-like C-terminal region-containing protein [Afifellaceae bacterium]